MAVNTSCITRRAKKVRKGDLLNLAGVYGRVKEVRKNPFGDIAIDIKRGRGKYATRFTFIVPPEQELKINRYPNK